MITRLSSGFVLPVLFALLMIPGCASSQKKEADPSAGCPILALGETPRDCPWAEVVRAWGKNPSATLAELNGPLHASLARDSAAAAIRSAWGQSLNFDENAKHEIIEPYVLADLEKAFMGSGTPDLRDERGHRIVHAGLQHTYGYLLNNLKTPFGYKRARWVQGEIERGFGLKEGLLGPTPSDGSFLANVTYFAAQLIHSKSEPELKKLAAPELRKFPYRAIASTRLSEKLALDPSFGQIVIRTDLIPFPIPQTDAYLLVYSISDSRAGHGAPRLITAFPVQSGFASDLIAPAKLGKDQEIATRYNAYVAGVTGQKLKGVRQVETYGKR